MLANRKWKAILSYKYFYIMFLPVLVWYLIFCYVPMYGLIMAFENFTMSKGFFRSPFVGLSNFISLFQDEYFIRAFWNTVIIASYRALFGFPFGVFIALLLNEVRNIKFRKSIQTVIYLPHFLSWVIIASIFMVITSPESGLIVPVFNAFGLQAPSILTDPGLFRPILIITDIWKEAGFDSIIFVAAIAGIDPMLYEASFVDGANRWQQLWNITIPGISSTIIVVLVLTLGQALTWGFDQVYNMYNQMVYSTGDILDTYIFRTALSDNKFSYAAAVGFFRSLICATLLFASNKASRKFTGSSIY